MPSGAMYERVMAEVQWLLWSVQWAIVWALCFSLFPLPLTLLTLRTLLSSKLMLETFVSSLCATVVDLRQRWAFGIFGSMGSTFALPRPVVDGRWWPRLGYWWLRNVKNRKTPKLPCVTFQWSERHKAFSVDIWWYQWYHEFCPFCPHSRFTKWVPGGWRDGEGCFRERQAGVLWTPQTRLSGSTGSSWVRGRKWIPKRKNASCWSNNDSNGWRCTAQC